LRAEYWQPDPPRPPSQPRAINLPPLVKRLMIASAAVYVLWILLPPNWAVIFLYVFGFIPARYSVGDVSLPALVGPLTHQFLHGGVLHLVLNMVMLAAFGAGVERALGARRMLVFYLVCGAIGAFGHFAVYPQSTIPVVGASGSISGLFGGVLRLIAMHARAAGRAVRLLPAILIWIGISVIAGFTGLPGAEDAEVAWAAHVGGFLAGLALFGFFVPVRRGHGPAE